jgi:hypothetical protein
VPTPCKAGSVWKNACVFVARLLDGEDMTAYGASSEFRQAGDKIFDLYKEHGLEEHDRSLPQAR